MKTAMKLAILAIIMLTATAVTHKHKGKKAL